MNKLKLNFYQKILKFLGILIIKEVPEYKEKFFLNIEQKGSSKIIVNFKSIDLKEGILILEIFRFDKFFKKKKVSNIESLTGLKLIKDNKFIYTFKIK